MLLILYLICVLFTSVLTLYETYNPGSWSTIEALAEEHPYVAAILNHEKQYVCTGVVIDKRTVLTSGACITPQPYFVSVGTAVFHRQLNNINLFQVAYARLHNDYIFDVNENNLNISRMHSNIGIVFTFLPILEHFFGSAVLSNYYASELKEKLLVLVGFGNVRSSEGVVLQQQTYHQMACTNPKWYYCVCGIEYSDVTFEEPFGEGGPVLYNDEIVGIAACASGSLTFKPNLNYNIFTVIGPYIAWIDKTKSDSIVQFIAEPMSDNEICKISSKELMCISIFLIKIVL